MMRRLLAWGIVLILAARLVPTQAAPLAECRLTHQPMTVATTQARPSCCAPENSPQSTATISGTGYCRLLAATQRGQTPPAFIASGDVVVPPVQSPLTAQAWDEIPPRLPGWTCLLDRMPVRGQPPPRAPPPFA